VHGGGLPLSAQDYGEGGWRAMPPSRGPGQSPGLRVSAVQAPARRPAAASWDTTGGNRPGARIRSALRMAVLIWRGVSRLGHGARRAGLPRRERGAGAVPAAPRSGAASSIRPNSATLVRHGRASGMHAAAPGGAP
jgi:hypothetical protein